MARLSKAEQKYTEAIQMLRNSGADPLDYALSYVMGNMDTKRLTEYVHEFEEKRVTVTLSDYDRPKLELVR